MVPYLRRFPRYVPMVLGVIALASVGALAAWNFAPALFPPHAHDLLGAFPLGLIAFAYLAHQIVVRRPEPKDLAKAILLAIAFFSWAVNQLWPDLPQAGLFNDAAIALFVFDVFLAMIGRPSGSHSPVSDLLAEQESAIEGLTGAGFQCGGPSEHKQRTGRARPKWP